MSKPVRRGLCGRCPITTARSSSDTEIMSISGHATLKELVRYTKAADQAKMARNAMAKVVIR